LDPSIALPLQVGFGADSVERLLEFKLCISAVSIVLRLQVGFGEDSVERLLE